VTVEALAENQLPEIQVLRVDDKASGLGLVPKINIRRLNTVFRSVQHVVTFVTQPLDNEARDIFVGKQVHTRRPSTSLLKDALIHRQHVGSVLVRRLNVLRLQVGIVV
jgi:hypothetical protein